MPTGSPSPILRIWEDVTFHLAKFLNLRAKQSDNAAQLSPANQRPPRQDEGSAVHLLLISRDDHFEASFREIADSCGWTIFRVREVEEAPPVLLTKWIPLVIYDWSTADTDWRKVVDRLTGMRADLCVLLASPVVDEYLWQEVIRRNGYDVLARSAARDQLIRAVQFAWFWKRKLAQKDSGARQA